MLAKLVIASSFIFAAGSAQAFCSAKPGQEIHQTFCRSMDHFACAAHEATVCQWNGSAPAQINIYAGYCTSKPGQDIHRQFCSSMDHFACAAHEATVCDWIAQ